MSDDLARLAVQLAGQRPGPWHVAAEDYAGTAALFRAGAEDLAAAQDVVVTWPRSVGSAGQAAFAATVDGGRAALAEWAAFATAMARALRTGAAALDAAHTAVPAMAEAYEALTRRPAQPVVAPETARLATELTTIGVALMAALGTALQAPTLVAPPARGWHGGADHHGGSPADPIRPAPAITAAQVGVAARQVSSLARRGVRLTLTIRRPARRRGGDSAVPALLHRSTGPRLAGADPSWSVGPPPAAAPPPGAPGSVAGPFAPLLAQPPLDALAGPRVRLVEPGLRATDGSAPMLADPGAALLGRTSHGRAGSFAVPAAPHPSAPRLPGDEMRVDLDDELFRPVAAADSRWAGLAP